LPACWCQQARRIPKLQYNGQTFATMASTQTLAEPGSDLDQASSLPDIAFYSPSPPPPGPTPLPSSTSSSSIRRFSFFSPAPAPPRPPNRDEKEQARQIELGRTIRTLQPLLPTLLQKPLPAEILSPDITLHLFPSTHPHLPTVSGKVAYTAALWTAPVAWGRIPHLGRFGGREGMRLIVESERMFSLEPGRERLVVRWRTASTPTSSITTKGEPPNSQIGGGIKSEPAISGDSDSTSRPGQEKPDDGFQGLFVFEFDSTGKIGKHIIENVDRDDGKSAARVISLAEWLIRLAKGATRKEPAGFALGCSGKAG
jgi:hypothetical protein